MDFAVAEVDVVESDHANPNFRGHFGDLFPWRSCPATVARWRGVLVGIIPSWRATGCLSAPFESSRARELESWDRGIGLGESTDLHESIWCGSAANYNGRRMRAIRLCLSWSAFFLRWS